MSDHSNPSSTDSELHQRNNNINHTIQNRESLRYPYGTSYGTLDEMNESNTKDESMNGLPVLKAKNSSVGSLHEDITSEDRMYVAQDPLSSPNSVESFQLIQDKALSFMSAATNASYTTVTTTVTPTNKEQEPMSEPAIISGAVANLCSATLGAGVLALPFALYQAGIVFGIILLLVSAWATVYSIDLIVAACHIYDIYTYEGLTEAALGKNMKFWLELSILVFSGGVAVAYIIAVGDILEKSHLLIQNSRQLTILLVWCIAMVPLSMLRKMQSLQFASAFGIASIGTLVFAAAVHLFQDETAVKSEDQVSTFDVDIDAANITDVFLSCLWPSHGFLSVLTACPVILFAFSCQCNVAAIFEELPEKLIKSKEAVTSMSGDGNGRSSNTPINASNRTTTTNQTQPISNNSSGSGSPIINSNLLDKTVEIITKDVLMHKVIICSVSICSLLYASISLIALSDFGKSMTPNMLSSYRPVGVMQIAMAAMSVAVVMSFPLNIFPARVTITGWMLGTTFDDRFFAIDTSEEDEMKKNATIDEAAALLGCSNNDIENRAAENFESTESSMTTALLQPQQQLLPGATTTTTDFAKITTDNDDDDDDIFFSWKRHLFLTLSLTISSLALALVLPNISVVFGLLGGTAASFLGFVVPGFIGLQLSKDLFGDTNNSNANRRTFHRSESCVNSTTIDVCSSKGKLQCISWSLLVGGACIGVLTTAVTLFNIFVPM